MAGEWEPPTHEQFSEEVLSTFEGRLDSVDYTEITLGSSLEDVLDLDDEEIDTITREISELPDRERRMTLLKLALEGEIPVVATMFGIPVSIIAQKTGPTQGPDQSGDREPRNPIVPVNSGHLEL